MKKDKKKANVPGYGIVSSAVGAAGSFTSKLAKVAYPVIANANTGSNLSYGEFHIPQITPTGIKMANYAGPGTDVIGRLKLGIKPLNTADTSA